ncbi:MAG: exosortase system-associated protein, TIGR04073 family [Verrucomicrobia bacterium]|nr:exosortase system-associated protein, TIGR04073 family [Verrucomicrobiota bacterium]
MKMTRTTGWKIMAAAAVSAAVFAAPLRADDNAGTKLLRGLAGLTLGLLEVPGNMTEIARKDSVPEGLTEGFFKGSLMFLTRSIVGVYEVITFPFPIKDYKPVVEPTYPWGYFCGPEEKPAAPAAPAQR